MCVCAKRGLDVCVFRFDSMRLCIHVFMHITRVYTAVSAAVHPLAVISVVRFDYSSRATRNTFPLNQTFMSSLWIWLLSATKLILLAVPFDEIYFKIQGVNHKP